MQKKTPFVSRDTWELGKAVEKTVGEEGAALVDEVAVARGRAADGRLGGAIAGVTCGYGWERRGDGWREPEGAEREGEREDARNVWCGTVLGLPVVRRRQTGGWAGVEWKGAQVRSR